MDIQRVDAFILASNKYFHSYQIGFVRDYLSSMDESRWLVVQSLQFKDPTLALIISLLVGALGIDRFYIGNTTLGILKLLTLGGCGIWTVVDWFLIMNATRDANIHKLERCC